MQHLQSKTVVGLLIILGIATGLALVGKLSAEMVDVLKWVGTSYMGVRGIVNALESKFKSEDGKNS